MGYAGRPGQLTLIPGDGHVSQMDCVFCKIVGGKIPARILSDTVHSMSFLDACPLAKGHVLVVSKRHREKVQDLSVEENADLFLAVHRMASRVDGLTGATLIAVHNGRDAGQEVPHVHVHLVPRSPGDSACAIHGMFGPAAPLADDEAEELHGKLKD